MRDTWSYLALDIERNGLSAKRVAPTRGVSAMTSPAGAISTLEHVHQIDVAIDPPSG